MEIQKSDDTSHVSEIIKEKLTELLEPTEIITETVTPPDTFIPFTETEENTINLQNEIEPEEITPEEKDRIKQMVDDLVERAKIASKEYMKLDQETINQIIKKNVYGRT